MRVDSKRAVGSGFVAAICVLAGLQCPVGAALAQSFPDRALRLIVPFPPGGPSDISARSIAAGLGASLGKPVVVENRSGAGAIVGTQALLNMPADGYTIMMASNSLAYGYWLYKDIPFNAVRETRAVIGVSTSPNVVVVSPSFPGSGIQDLIRMAKERSGGVNFASGGTGTIPHLGGELFMQMAGVKMTHIPYKGTSGAIQAILADDVQTYFDILFAAQPLIKAGRLKALGVTSLKRDPAFPNIATLDEQGVKGYELISWFGIVTRVRVPDSVVAQLNDAINGVLQTAAVRERLASLGANIVGGTPDLFAGMIEKESELWRRVIRSASISIE